MRVMLVLALRLALSVRPCLCTKDCHVLITRFIVCMSLLLMWAYFGLVCLGIVTLSTLFMRPLRPVIGKHISENWIIALI